MTLVDDLTPAMFDTDATAHAHAAWTWALRFEAEYSSASLRHLTARQLRDVRLAADVFVALVDAEMVRQEMAVVTS